MTAYYNEIDPFAAEWLRQLIGRGLIAPGDVDTRSVEDVKPDDIRGYEQCHFFAGIGGWSYALRRAGWPDDRKVWTGSCPCQPFSAAGKGGGFADERHVWPSWYHLVGECRPDVIFGEQVASQDGLNWFGLVQADLEGAGYAVGVVDICAAGVGAPHIRQRLYFVAEGVGYAINERLEGFSGNECRGEGWPQETGSVAQASSVGDWEWVRCADGWYRPIEPGTWPLANGIPARVGRLRGYGNAINVENAREFIQAYVNHKRG